MTRRPGTFAFTLIEVLAALFFLAILVPAVLQALTVATRASSAAERSGTAAQLAENQLESMIVDGSWSNGAGRGDFGSDWPGYRWELTSSDWSEDTMTQLSMTVYYLVQNREQKVQLTTLVSSLQSNTP